MNSKRLKNFASLVTIRSPYINLLMGLLIIVGCLLSTGKVYAARCSNVNVEFLNVPDEINLVGKEVGDVIYSFEHAVSGTCTKGGAAQSQGQFLYFINRFKPIPPSVWCTDNVPGSYARYVDPTGYVEFSSTQQDCLGHAYYLGLFANTNINVTGPLTTTPLSIRGALTLKKKVIGRVTLDPFFFWPTDFVSMLGGYPETLQNEMANVTGIKRSMTLVYTPACSASVNDVDFGNAVSMDSIQNASLSQTATVYISCEDILPAYTIKLSSPEGVYDNQTIKSVNTTVGYRLSFENNANLELNNELLNVVVPSAPIFEIPIVVQPVSLVGNAGNIQPGSANSSISIELKFN